MLAHVIVHVITISIDPSDPRVLRKKKPKIKFDEMKHQHVIENQHCNICQVNVKAHSNHCRVCNKCVWRFDYHCHYVNNCIGGRNYRWYMATLGTAFVALCLISGLAVTEFTFFFTDQTNRHILQPYRDLNTLQTYKDANFKILYQSVPYEAWLTVLAFTFTLGTSVAVAVLGLICVHIYLTRHKSTIFKSLENPSKAYVPVKVESYMSGATLNSGSFTIELVTGLPWVSTVHTTRSAKNSAKNNNNECELKMVDETCSSSAQSDNSSMCSLSQDVVSLAPSTTSL